MATAPMTIPATPSSPNQVTPRDNPSTTSSDYDAMIDGWTTIADILAGVATIKGKTIRYLPQHQRESPGAYALRLASAPWRPEFEDALNSLSSKPFTKTVSLNENAPDTLIGKVTDEKTKERSGGLVDDIDGQGNSLHVFARETFTNGIGYGLEAIYVTYPDAPPARTVAEEKAVGNRPYWVHVRARDIIEIKLVVIAGRTVVNRMRITECTNEADGYAEVRIERVRELFLDETNRPAWRLHRKMPDGKYVLEREGTLFGVKQIPVALFFTATRSGNYFVKPPLLDLAGMQLELFRALSRLDQIQTLAGSPMLKGVGFKPPAPTKVKDASGKETEKPAPQIEVGPGVVLFAPPTQEGSQPDWDYIQPNADNMREIRESVDKVMEDFRRLAMQPTTPQSGNMVATGQAIDAAKGHTAVEAWANGLKDALDQALVFTCQWLKISDTVTASVYTDFGIDAAGVEEAKVVGTATAAGVISKKRNAIELARRNILGPDYDYDQDQEQMGEEQQGMDTNAAAGEPQIDPITGLPIVPKQPPGGGDGTGGAGPGA